MTTNNLQAWSLIRRDFIFDADGLQLLAVVGNSVGCGEEEESRLADW